MLIFNQIIDCIVRVSGTGERFPCQMRLRWDDGRRMVYCYERPFWEQTAESAEFTLSGQIEDGERLVGAQRVRSAVEVTCRFGAFGAIGTSISWLGSAITEMELHVVSFPKKIVPRVAPERSCAGSHW